MLLFLTFFFVYLALNIIENCYRERWKYELDRKAMERSSRVWHSVQSIRWGVVIIVVAYLLLGISKHLVLLIPLSAVWKILFDGFLNVARMKDFWYQSPHVNLSFWERYSTKRNKLIFLIITIIITIAVEVLC